MHTPNNDLTRIFLDLYAERVAIMEIDGYDNNAEKNAYSDTVRTIQEKTGCDIKQLLAWNYAKLPNNTFELQFSKYEEEIDEAIEAETISYQKMIEELADVLIAIGGMARFDLPLAIEMLNGFLDCLDKYIFMDVVDYAEQKIKILYKRSYSNGYHHDEVLQ